MKKIGLIGGMSWESTVPYYTIINNVINQELGGLHSADCILHSVDFNEVESTISVNDWNASDLLLSDAAQKLEIAGADFIAICSNTMHKCIPAMMKKTKLPILHIVDATAKDMKTKGIRKALLLGTRFTMEEQFNKDRFEKDGIEIIIPKREDRDIIHKIIFEELCKGIIREDSRKEYVKIIEKECSDSTVGVILGCTEIGLLINQEQTKVPVFDTTQIHAKEIALFAISEVRNQME